MSKHILVTCAICATVRLFAIDVHQYESNVVGYHSSCISQGISSITINSDSLNIFPTLGDVVKFHPCDAIVGDEISFLLDGLWQTYCFASYDGTNAVLTTNRDPLPKRITLNGIPLLDTYKFNHKNSQVVSVETSGGIAPRYARATGLKKAPPSYGITVKYESSTDNMKHPLGK